MDRESAQAKDKADRRPVTGFLDTLIMPGLERPHPPLHRPPLRALFLVGLLLTITGAAGMAREMSLWNRGRSAEAAATAVTPARPVSARRLVTARNPQLTVVKTAEAHQK